MLQPAAVTPQTGEAVGQDPAGEELAKLLLDKPRQAAAVAALGCFTHERLQVPADHRVECCAT